MPNVPNTIRIRTTLTSDTPHLPELATLVGKPVEITVREETPRTAWPPEYDEVPAEYPWPPAEVVAAANAALAELHATADDGDYDYDAWWKGREIDRQRMAEEWRRQGEAEQS